MLLQSLYLKISLAGYKLLGSLFMSLSILNIFLPCLHIVKHCFWKDLRQSDCLPSLVNDSISWCGCSEKPFLFIFKPVWPHWIDFARKKKKTFLVYIFYLPFISRKFVWIRVFHINSVPCFGFFWGNFFYTLIGSSLPIFCITSALIYLFVNFFLI